MERVLSSLAEREIKILKSYYGLTGEYPQSIDDIATSLGITRERISQLKEKALAKLKNKSTNNLLRDFLG